MDKDRHISGVSFENGEKSVRSQITDGLAHASLGETVTVITPAHNSGRWLDETIRSVRSQTDEDWRYYIVDDRSQDNSFDIAQQHAAEDPRIEVFRANNGSVALTRQEGVAQVQEDSPFVAFLDGDDVWRPQFIEQARRRFQQFGENVLAVYGAHGLIDEHSRPIGQPTDPKMGSSDIEMMGMVDFDKYLLGDTPARTASAVMVRTEALRGHEFRQAAEPCEDYELWLRILDSNSQGAFYGTQEQLLDYRIREGQLTGKTREVFATLDRMYVEFVPRMRQPETRWEIYEYAKAGARNRGCPEYAVHFNKMAARLADDPAFVPYVLEQTD